MQPITHGRLRDLLPSGHDVWLDGGHNAHGAAALARSIAALPERPLVLIMGMMNTRDPALFLGPFRQLGPRSVLTLTIPGEKNAHLAQAIAKQLPPLASRRSLTGPCGPRSSRLRASTMPAC